jgi:hypothetical protein
MALIKLNNQSVAPVTTLPNLASLPSGIDTGKIGQVLSVTKTDVVSSSSTSYLDISGLSLSITPTATNSKIFITVDISGGHSSGSANYRITRGGTVVTQGNSAGSRRQVMFQRGSSAGNRIDGVGSNFLDSPNTTSATTYQVQWSIQNAGVTIYLNRSPDDSDNESHPRGTSTLTIMEILA